MSLDTRSSNTGRERAWRAHALVVILLLVVSGAVYSPTLELGFLHLDDPDYIEHNPLISSFSAKNLRQIFSAPYFANYSPGHLLSYSLDVALAGGRKPWAMHLSNLLWNCWVVCMVYLLAFTIRAEILPAAAAALLFSLHPAHVEVVAWLSSRKDLVATGFAALSMALYLGRNRPGSSGAGHYAASLAAFVLASSGKTSVILLPVVMLVWEVLAARGLTGRMLAGAAPFALVSWFFGLMSWNAQPSTNQVFSPFVAAAAQISDLWLLTGLGEYVMFRPAPAPDGLGHAVRGSLLAVVALFWAAPLLLAKLRQPVRAALCFWVLIQLLPPLVPGFLVPVTDRYLFLPSVGACILLAHLAADVAARLRSARHAAWAVVAGFGLLWGIKTWSYLGEWRDPRTLWYFAAPKVRTAQAHEYLGNSYQNAAERLDAFLQTGAFADVAAETRLARAVLGDPEALRRLAAEWRDGSRAAPLSAAYRERLRDLAWENYERAVERLGTLSAPKLFLRRGMLLVSRGRHAQAIPELETALRFAEVDSDERVRRKLFVHLLRALGSVNGYLGRFQPALASLRRAQELQRGFGEVWVPTLDQEVDLVQGLAEKP